MYDDDEKEEILDNAVEQFEKPNRDFAKVRDANATLAIILIIAALVHVVLGAFAYSEITITRYNQVLTFAIVWTAALSVCYLIPFYIARIYFALTIEKQFPLYDRKIIRNMQDQATINYVLPFASIIIIIVRWSFYGKVGTDDSFSTIQGFFYGMSARTVYAAHLISVLIIVRTVLSYYYRNIHITERKQTQSKIKESAYFGMTREEIENENRQSYELLYK
jgi:hypothetical protein